MKMLYIIRHAKSSWENANLSDFDRPLNERGKKDAPEMAKRMKEKKIFPDLILSSPAKRARKTAEIFADILGYDKSLIKEVPDVYEASVYKLMYTLKNIEPKYGAVFVFGHNPGFTDFVNTLADVRIDNIPTCGVAALRLNTEWEKAEKGFADLSWFDYPKNICL